VQISIDPTNTCTYCSLLNPRYESTEVNVLSSGATINQPALFEETKSVLKF